MSQVRKPDRFAGRLFAILMNQSHSRLTDWGLMHIRIEKDFTILDVGCGGGRTIGKLAAMASNGKVYGIDYAAGSVATSRSHNKELIRSGQVEIEQAPVSNLPFAADTFDLLTAIETQYYWPDLPSDMREVLRVLKSGGCSLSLPKLTKAALATLCRTSDEALWLSKSRSERAQRTVCQSRLHQRGRF